MYIYNSTYISFIVLLLISRCKYMIIWLFFNSLFVVMIETDISSNISIDIIMVLDKYITILM